MQDQTPYPAAELYDSVVMQEFSKISPNGRRIGGFGCTKIDQQDAGAVCRLRQESALISHVDPGRLRALLPILNHPLNWHRSAGPNFFVDGYFSASRL